MNLVAEIETLSTKAGLLSFLRARYKGSVIDCEHLVLRAFANPTEITWTGMCRTRPHVHITSPDQIKPPGTLGFAKDWNESVPVVILWTDASIRAHNYYVSLAVQPIVQPSGWGCVFAEEFTPATSQEIATWILERELTR